LKLFQILIFNESYYKGYLVIVLCSFSIENCLVFTWCLY